MLEATVGPPPVDPWGVLRMQLLLVLMIVGLGVGAFIAGRGGI